MADLVEFDPYDAMKGLVDTLDTIIGDYVGEAIYLDENGDVVDIEGVPAIYIGNQNFPSPNYPLIYILYGGQISLGTKEVAHGLAEDPEISTSSTGTSSDSSELIPYVQKRIRYTVTLWAQGGPVDKVAQGDYKSADYLLNRIINSFNAEAYMTLLNNNTNSSLNVQTKGVPSPITNTDGTIVDASSMQLTFDAIDTIFDRTGTGYFNRVKVGGRLLYNEDDSTAALTINNDVSYEDAESSANN